MKTKNIFTVMMILCCLAIANVAMAQTTFYVKETGTGLKDGSSWGNAYDGSSLRSVLRNATSGTTFWVAKGTYIPDATKRDSSFFIPSGVKVYGGFAGTETLLSEQDPKTNPTSLSGEIGNFTPNDNIYHVVRFYRVNNATTLDGFTIIYGCANGTADNSVGGGILNDGRNYVSGSNPTIANCNIVNNFSTGNGGGIYSTADNGVANITITNCVFENDSTNGSGGAIYLSISSTGNATSSNTITNCKFINNGSYSSGGAVCSSAQSGHTFEVATVNNTFTNCLFAKNYARVDGGVYYSNAGSQNAQASSTFMNCTLADNDAGNDAGAVKLMCNFPGSSANAFTNCIFWNNKSNSSPLIFNYASALFYSNYQGGWTGTGNNNLNAVPQFLYSGNDPYNLSPCSPCINTGISAGMPTIDILGTLRPQIGKHDIGAYESLIKNTPQTKVYVNKSAIGSNDGSSWANAYTDLQSALLNTCLADTVWVAKETYNPATKSRDSSFVIPSGMKVYGGFAGTETLLSERDVKLNQTILSGEIVNASSLKDNSYHVVEFISAVTGTRLDGFQIVSGYADNNTNSNNVGGAIFNDGRYSNAGSNPTIANCNIVNNFSTGNGGGIYSTADNGVANITITNCVFENDSTNGSGGAIYLSTNSTNDTAISINTITNCKFINNGAYSSGGAIYSSIYSNYTYNVARANSNFTNCLFAKNYARVDGGAYYSNAGSQNAQASSTFTNCTLANNTAGNDAGAVKLLCNFPGSSANEFTNCIFWSNKAKTNPNLIFGSNYPTCINFSDYEGGWLGCGNNNINNDPLFLNPSATNYIIASCSPCVDSGTSVGSPNFDLDSISRPKFNGYDIGAYESQSKGMVAANISISVLPNDTICSGTPVTFSTTSNISSLATFQWMRNGSKAGTNSTYSANSLKKDDKITCKIKTTANCFAPDSATSNEIKMFVKPLPSANFTANNTNLAYTFSNNSTNANSYKWYFGDGDSLATSSPNDVNHTYSTSGTDTVTLIATNDCGSNTFKQIVSVVNGVNEIIATGHISLFPNPCTQCHLTTTAQEKDLTVTDMLGRNCKATFTKSADGYLMEMPDYVGGIYFVHNIKTGEVAKFVKE